MQMHQKKQEKKLLPSSEDQSDVERHCETSIGLSKPPATRPTEEKNKAQTKEKTRTIVLSSVDLMGPVLWTGSSYILFMANLLCEEMAYDLLGHAF